jgi:hypothetical protein
MKHFKVKFVGEGLVETGGGEYEEVCWSGKRDVQGIVL